MAESSPLLRPKPRRAFETTPASTPADLSACATPSPAASDSYQGEAGTVENIPSAARTQSIQNLTASTLFGIYAPSDVESSREAPLTPWGTGALTPSRQATIDEHKPIVLPATAAFPHPSTAATGSPTPLGIKNHVLPLIRRTGLLFLFGIAYGVVIAHLHDSHRLAPVNVDNIDQSSWRYLISWGLAGVFLGRMLPWVDIFWEEALGAAEIVSTSTARTDTRISPGVDGCADESPSPDGEAWMGADWNPVVRSVGAFIGIAFAIRKLPWQSTLQVSLTLAMVNPFLWYVVDRSKPGFFLSSLVGITGTAVLLGINPGMVPSPPVPPPPVQVDNASYDHSIHPMLISHESIYGWTWIASVLFCSSVCFGNIGRRLALGQTRRNPNTS